MEPWKFDLVRTWAGMLSRCNDKSDSSYHGYGGRGISVCERWSSFDNFVEDMGPRPDGMTLDRIDNDGNYSPENCRWADKTTQANNRRNNRPITANGVTKNLQTWARELGVDAEVIKYRLGKGWSPEEAVSALPYSKRSDRVLITHDGRTGTCKQWEIWTGISRHVINSRYIQKGWSAEKTLTTPVGLPLGGLAGKGNVSGRRKDNVMLTVDGETKSLAEWSRLSGTPQSTIRRKYRRGLPHEEAVYGKPSQETV